MARLSDRLHDVAPIGFSDRDGVHHAKESGHSFEIVKIAVQHEMHEAWQRRADHESIDERYVVRDEQCGTIQWQIFATHDPDSINSVGQKPEDRAHEVIGKQVENGQRSDQRDATGQQNNRVGREVEGHFESPVNSRSQKDPYRIDEIIGRDQLAFFFFAALLL